MGGTLSFYFQPLGLLLWLLWPDDPLDVILRGIKTNKTHSITFPCPVRPFLAASPTPSHDADINHQVFYFFLFHFPLPLQEVDDFKPSEEVCFRVGSAIYSFPRFSSHYLYCKDILFTQTNSDHSYLK